MSVSRSASIAATCAALLGPAACGGAGGFAQRPAASAVPAPAGARTAAATWTGLRHVRGVVDLTAPDAGGRMVVAARGRLLHMDAAGGLTAFAPRYAAPPGLEPYIVASSGQVVPGAGCRFAPGAVYALRLAGGNGVTEVTAAGAVRRFAALPRAGLENGIAFDTTGRFGHRLLVTRVQASRTTVYAIDCRGQVRTVTARAPRVEGGLAVAPAGFGRFRGDLIAPDELSGRIYAVGPGGSVALVARPGLAHGQDVGVESEGFVPSRYREALVADRRTQRNRHPGDDLILRLPRAALGAAGVRAGDLLAVAEGGAATVAIRCVATGCHVMRVAGGPAIAHIEGHVVFR